MSRKHVKYIISNYPDKSLHIKEWLLHIHETIDAAPFPFKYDIHKDQLITQENPN